VNGIRNGILHEAETRKCHLARRTVSAHCPEGAGRLCPDSNSLLQRSKGGVRILDWITSMGSEDDATGRKKLSKILRMKCHLRSALKGVEILR
jgi:hypothetical protein